jgi:hypothetical protein
VNKISELILFLFSLFLSPSPRGNTFSPSSLPRLPQQQLRGINILFVLMLAQSDSELSQIENEFLFPDFFLRQSLFEVRFVETVPP